MSKSNPKKRNPPHDNCDNCGNDYEFDCDKDSAVIYLTTDFCNHIEAVCPHCEQETRIFCEPSMLLRIIDECSLQIKLGAAAPADMQERMSDEMLSADVSTADTWSFLPELTSNELRSLSNDIRKLERGDSE